MRKFVVLLCLMALIYGGVSVLAPDLPNKTVKALENAAQSNSVEGKPTLSAAFVDKVLTAASSKAAGTGQALYDLSVKYGIDDAYALAFFQHESTFGTGGVARATFSLGNIRCSEGYRCIEGYRAYSSWVQGYADWYRLIRTLYIGEWHLSTVEQIVPKYAPASENDVAGYIAAVEKAVQSWRAGNL